MDHVSREVRSKIMSAVRSQNGRTTEAAIEKIFQQAGLRGYRRQWPVDGRPDFAWPRLKIAVFVDGCFWHGCTRCKYLPRTNTRFWRDKIEANKRRDNRVSQRLRRKGWSVARIRECRVASAASLERVYHMLLRRRAAVPRP
jgi:DNA mismatch endonuclease, patch repair protein